MRKSQKEHYAFRATVYYKKPNGNYKHNTDFSVQWKIETKVVKMDKVQAEIPFRLFS